MHCLVSKQEERMGTQVEGDLQGRGVPWGPLQFCLWLFHLWYCLLQNCILAQPSPFSSGGSQDVIITHARMFNFILLDKGAQMGT